MSVGFANNLNIPDFSCLTEVVRKQQEVMLPIIEAVQAFKRVLEPISKYSDTIRANVLGFAQTMVEVFKPINAVNRLSQAQYVCWHSMGSSFVDAIVSSTNVDDTIIAALVEDDYASVKYAISQIENHPFVEKHARVYAQAVNAYNMGWYDLAVNGFTSLLDGLLSDVSGNHITNFGRRLQPIYDKIDAGEVLDSEEHISFSLAATFQKTIETFTQKAPFTELEPEGLNRHWIAHGRSTREKTQLDAIKMINMIYGLLLICDVDAMK